MEQNRSFNIFCENCDNILDIARSLKNNNFNDSETPIALSENNISETKSDKSEINYEYLLKKVENEEVLIDDELKSIDIKDMVKNEYYKKMAKKGEIKKRIIDMIDDMGNSDSNKNAYMICKKCSFSKIIESGFCIVSKSQDGSISYHDYINESFYRNKIHISTMPYTRNFNCPNKECPVYVKKISPEAIFFRKNSESYEIIYVCKRCLTVKYN